MMNFIIKYFDGLSSKTYHAKLQVNNRYWTICFTDNDTQIEKIWHINEIKKSNVFMKDYVTFNYGNSFPFQRIESNDPKFIKYIQNHKNRNLNHRFSSSLQNVSIKSLSGLVTGVIGVILICYFFIIPSLAQNFANTTSKSSVVRIGDYVFSVLSKELDINYEESEKLQDFVDNMTIPSDFEIEAYVVESKELNAFAISGGKIIINSSLLDQMSSKQQLVALIGHEVAHIENRHMLNNIVRNISGALFISIIFGDINGITAIIADNAFLYSELSFSRALEKEADLFGLKVMRQNQVDLNGMPDLFRLLQENSKMNIPFYLSSHPALEDRIAYTMEIARNQDNFADNNGLDEKWKTLKKLEDVER